MVEATDILRWFRRYGWSAPPGEWGAITDSSRRPYRAVLESGDVELLDQMCATLFRHPCIAGLVSLHYHELGAEDGLARFSASLRLNLRLWEEFTPGAQMHRLAVTERCGIPPCVGVSGVSVMVDTPRHDHYAGAIATALPDGGLVFEIGGGYGGLALQLLRWNPRFRVVLCDLPETLYLAGYWLSRVISGSVGWWDESPDATIRLLPSDDLDHWLETPDLVVATHSLSEVGPVAAQRYMDWLRSRAVRWFYHDNAVFAPTVLDGSRTAEIWPEVLAPELDPGPPYVERWSRAIHWATSGERYREYLYERMP